MKTVDRAKLDCDAINYGLFDERKLGQQMVDSCIGLDATCIVSCARLLKRGKV